MPHDDLCQGPEKRSPPPRRDRCSKDSRDVSNYLKIFYSNLDTFLNKKAEILNIIDNDSPDILAFTEILDKKNPVISDAELNIDGYETFFGINPKRGIVLYVKEELNPKRCQ